MKNHTSFIHFGIVCLLLQFFVSQTLVASPSIPEPTPTVAVHSALLATPTPIPLSVTPGPSATASPAPTPSKKKSSTVPVSKVIPKQKPGAVFPEILKKADTEPVSILVSLSKQRVYLLVGGKVAIDSPISSGKKDGWTPKGEFVILEKDPDHRSNLYGDFIDESGKICRSGISSIRDAAPSGTHYRGASMKYFMRLTSEGVGMHAGILPGYPASHGCIRLPLEMASLIYHTVIVSTPVSVTDQNLPGQN
jgi:lipoprotein-anchoring transpeptidase ErfK/SrfK